MKKISIIFVSILLVMTLAFSTFAVTPVQPFEKGTMSTEQFRIPAMWTLNNGELLMVADMRNTDGSDSPQNIDTLAAIYDGKSISHNIVSAFDDATLGVSDKSSASFIDSAVVQSKETGRVFIITTAYPSGRGTPNAEKGSGCIVVDGKKRIALTTKHASKKIADYKAYIGDFEDGFAPVFGTDKNYTVDEYYNLYLDGKKLFVNKIDNAEETVRQNVFFFNSDLSVFPTAFLSFKYSDDNGRTWSAPRFLNVDLKNENEAFFGACPGRGAITTVDGKERILFCVYDNGSLSEKASIIYSDDNGENWQRTDSLSRTTISGKSSESRIINCPDGSLRIFSRNTSKFITTAQSFDGGITWTKLKADLGLFCTKNCMVSFIATSHKIDGKTVVLGSYSHGANERKNGIIRTGLMDEKGNIEWTKIYHINEGFFAYSCLSELDDGRIACLYEDGPSKITLGIFELDDEGNISSVDGDDCSYSESVSFLEKFLAFFTKLFSWI